MKQRMKSSLALGVGVVAVAGLVLAPAAYAANTTTVTARIAKSITVATTTGSVLLNITPTSAGSATTASDTVTVTTNSAAGYTLKIASGTANLVNGANNLVPTAGTIAAPAALDNNAWGFRFDDATAGTGFGSGSTAAQTDVANPTSTKWAAVPTTATTIKTTAVAATSGDATNVFFGAKADMTKATGDYTATVTFTGTAN